MTGGTISRHLVIMGVAGCGKSSLGAAVARAQGLALVEGDDFHGTENRLKMSQGVALTDQDREGWLKHLCEELQRQRGGAVLTCSALKRQYRDRLRSAVPQLRFVFLDLTPEAAQQRVLARASHFFSADLVDSQFATLESPVGEPGVLRVDAAASIDDLQAQVGDWLNRPVLA